MLWEYETKQKTAILDNRYFFIDTTYRLIKSSLLFWVYLICDCSRIFYFFLHIE